MQRLRNIFWLGTKELRALLRDTLLVLLIVYAFTLAITSQALGGSAGVHQASIAIVDEDHSALSARIAGAFFAPQFQAPQQIQAQDVDRAMDSGRYVFVLVIPPRFEADLRAGRTPEVQIAIDATANRQAGIGNQHIQHVVSEEVGRFLTGSPATDRDRVRLVTRHAYNPNRTASWFQAVVALVNQISLITVILTGAALIREREHGTIEHLLVMPLHASEIALAKVWANGAVILAAVALSMTFVVRKLLGVPVVGSVPLFLLGTALYLFFATALGVFLGTIVTSMAQFSLLMILVIAVLQMLSGGQTPVESQPAWLQQLTLLLPSRHFVSFSQAILFRGAGLSTVWPQFLAITGLGSACFAGSLALFRRSIAASR